MGLGGSQPRGDEDRRFILLGAGRYRAAEQGILGAWRGEKGKVSPDPEGLVLVKLVLTNGGDGPVGGWEQGEEAKEVVRAGGLLVVEPLHGSDSDKDHRCSTLWHSTMRERER